MLLHLSDLHFGTEKPECLTAIKQFCRQHPIEAIAVSGDLTQRAKFVQFLKCKHFLDSLDIPYLVVPGNHDIPLYHVWHRMLQPFASYKLFFGETERVLETEHYCLIGVNSIRRRHHTRGHISLAQIQYIDEILKHMPKHKLKMVVVHQPFYASAQHPHGLKDCPILGKMALQAWSKNGLFALLHGHVHQAAVYDLNQIYHLQQTHPVLEIHAGTATSFRLHQNYPNSFNVLMPDGQVQHYQFHRIQQQFVLMP
ncbi:metallophosphoesterase family protein [Acinetobacter sp. MD2(2019)]|uniref:metallophosphoesterase family protein n=1 Tax=Acinetobacter sp. MD2(2019) TaxID=2605273 RepID=UPI002D1F6AB1|nr:metallophosphoesterase [Acinetobacter sp. MD2(2019)]MEB3753456.1 metallophosphoesterase [Acinetobacter sp. MD2(2019)]